MSVEHIVKILRCQYSGAPLHLSDGYLEGGLYRYPVVDGIPWLLAEDRLSELDRHFQQEYGEETARKYDVMIRLQSLLIGCWEPAERRRMVNLLDVPEGARILEIAVGTGSNLRWLSRLAGRSGEIVAVDLSLAMMRVAQQLAKALPSPVHFVRGDACHLPFADDTFDAVFHFGGLNTFGDMGAALREMVRVAKPGAPIVAGDEGMSEARRRTWLGRRLGRMNQLNLCRPPFAEVPWDQVEAFELHWAWRELFYVMRFRKRAQHGTVQQTQSTPPASPVERELARRARP